MTARNLHRLAMPASDSNPWGERPRAETPVWNRAESYRADPFAMLETDMRVRQLRLQVHPPLRGWQLVSCALVAVFIGVALAVQL